MFLAALALAFGALRASTILQFDLLHNTLLSPMQFFETTPSGRIMNRFAKDIDVIDSTLPGMFRMAFNCFFRTVTTVIVIMYATPMAGVAFAALSVFYFLIQVSSCLSTLVLDSLMSFHKQHYQ